MKQDLKDYFADIDAQLFLSFLFSHDLVEYRQQAEFTDKMFHSRNQSADSGVHPSSLHQLDKLMTGSARLIMACPALRASIPDACRIVDKFLDGRRALICEICPIYCIPSFDCPGLVHAHLFKSLFGKYFPPLIMQQN